MNKIAVLLLLFIFSACNFGGKSPSMLGHWKLHLSLKDDKKLPFALTINKDNTATLHNGAEKFTLKLEIDEEDKTKFKIPLHVIDAGIEAKFYFNKDKPLDKTQHLISGEWVKYYKKDYRVKVFGHRIENPSVNNYAIQQSGQLFHEKWEVTFADESKTKAVGYFKQKGSKITGTFLTSTGDYRPMEGQLIGNTFELYGFDGGYANLARGMVLKDRIKGEFWGGKNYYAKWEGIANAKAKLPDPYKLTFLKDPKDKLNFSIKDMNENTVKLDDPKFKGKAKIIMISGTWCPNCMDEAKYMGRWFKQNKHRGVEVFSLFFERSPSKKHAQKLLKRYAKSFNLQYHLLLASHDNKTKPIDIFPQLNKVMSYPTTIYLDKKDNVKKIHTGFNGPGTGDYFERWKQEFNLFMNDLLDN